jgi:murein DD-endopeptidase MepM/ murein hydrolase activator NlpD
VFEYELDFNTEIRPAARFSVVADVLSAPDRDPRLGTLHALRLENGGNVYTAIRHTDAAGTDAWYHPDGKSMKRPFLRSPLAFDARVTSSFGRRFHPIKKQYSVHLGTDFGARTGTPVRAVADGVVKYAAWNGGHGRYVKVDHEGGAKTSYSHLSAIAVKNGQRVKQGQVIGKVGSTGYSTGPHLHYQLWVGGKLVDALKAKLPHQAPLPTSERAAFATRVAEVLPLLPGVTGDELEKAGLDPDDVDLAVADRGE